MSQLVDRARATRAITEPMEIIATDKPWRFIVRTAHGVYAVDAQEKTCTCPDFQNRILKMRRQGNRDAMCKHLLRVVNGTRLLQAQLVIGTRKRSEWKEAV
jgi:hypothetical protein